MLLQSLKIRHNFHIWNEALCNFTVELKYHCLFLSYNNYVLASRLYPWPISSGFMMKLGSVRPISNVVLLPCRTKLLLQLSLRSNIPLFRKTCKRGYSGSITCDTRQNDQLASFVCQNRCYL